MCIIIRWSRNLSANWAERFWTSSLLCTYKLCDYYTPIPILSPLLFTPSLYVAILNLQDFSFTCVNKHCLWVYYDDLYIYIYIYHVSECREFTDDGFSEWTCGGGGQVVTTWSQCGLAGKGTTKVHFPITLDMDYQSTQPLCVLIYQSVSISQIKYKRILCRLSVVSYYYLAFKILTNVN